ncbi:Uncharacterised protein [uncultured archaeon]|nr:Uncharacterised protein [uncultured archaeon]
MNWDWIAGFYEGEGYIGENVHVSDSGQSRLVHLSISQTEKHVLECIRKFVGFGKVYPVTQKNKKHRKSWVYQLYGAKAIKFAKKILPKMKSKRKTKQLRSVIA